MPSMMSSLVRAENGVYSSSVMFRRLAHSEPDQGLERMAAGLPQ